MEGYNPQRNRATTAHLAPPLKLVQELMIDEDTPVGSPVVAANGLLLVEGNWQVEEGRLSNTAPVIANEQVYVRTVDGSILIYESGKVEGLSWQTLEHR